MKDVKTTRTSAKRKVNSSAKKPANKVKDVEFKQVNDDFMDEKEDNRLIVFIALAILVIVGTIIGLLVGCQKEEKEEPKKPQDDIVVPTKEEDKKEETSYDYEKPLPVVKKVTKKTTASKETTEEDEESDSEEETTEHSVTFHINGESEEVEVEDGSAAEAYVPAGYTDCKYYADENLTEEFDFEAGITEDQDVYMACSAITYTVVYLVEDTETSDTYSLDEGERALQDPSVPEGETFNGWYVAEAVLMKKVTALNKDLIEYVEENGLVSNNEICLRALIDDGTDLEETDLEETDEEEPEEGNETTEGLNDEVVNTNMALGGRSLLLNETTLEEEQEEEEGIEGTIPDEEELEEPKILEENKEESNDEEQVGEEVGEVNKEETPAPTEEEKPTVEEPKAEESTPPAEEPKVEEKKTEEVPKTEEKVSEPEPPKEVVKEVVVEKPPVVEKPAVEVPVEIIDNSEE